MNLYKIIKYLAIVVGIVAAVFTVYIIVEGKEAIESSADLQNQLLTPFMYITYVVLAISAILAVVFLVKDLFTGDDVKQTIFGFVGLAVIVLVAYLITSGEPQQLRDGSMLSASASHWISAALVIFYILGVFALGTMLFGGIKKLIK